MLDVDPLVEATWADSYCHVQANGSESRSCCPLQVRGLAGLAAETIGDGCKGMVGGKRPIPHSLAEAVSHSSFPVAEWASTGSERSRMVAWSAVRTADRNSLGTAVGIGVPEAAAEAGNWTLGYSFRQKRLEGHWLTSTAYPRAVALCSERNLMAQIGTQLVEL